ncbi:MAG: molybdenum cofactor guanylyltransferase [Bacteroidetes bacterium]|nr:MAG: molybdenum cofactor guanylyltransferase [Bacteroidota bacterium]
MKPELPPWTGLILAGGYSRRMGTDKALLSWHGQPQVVHLTDLLRAQGAAEVLVSCRPDQVAPFQALGLRPLPDLVPNLGPLGGLLSCFRAHPERACLSVAVDLPLLGAAALQALLEARQAGRPAMAFARPDGQGVDPLAALWEPIMGPLLEDAWQCGDLAPRRVLQRAGVFLLEPAEPDWLRNANTAEEALAIQQRIRALTGE